MSLILITLVPKLNPYTLQAGHFTYLTDVSPYYRLEDQSTADVEWTPNLEQFIMPQTLT